MSNKHTHDIVIFNLTKSQIDLIHKRLKGLTYETCIKDHEENPIDSSLNYAVWCETCQDWKTELTPDESNLWILCNDCNDGLIKVIK